MLFVFKIIWYPSGQDPLYRRKIIFGDQLSRYPCLASLVFGYRDYYTNEEKQRAELRLVEPFVADEDKDNLH